MTYHNACKLGPQTLAEAKKLNWQRMDYLAKHQLKTERDHKNLLKWFNAQDSEWQTSRRARFNQRAGDRMRFYK